MHRGSPSSPSPLWCWTNMEKGHNCRTLFLTWNHSDSVLATLTLARCFLYSLASADKSFKCRGYPMSIIVTQSLLWEKSWLSSWSPPTTYRVVAGARVPCASVFWDSWFDSLSPFLVGIPSVCLQFLFWYSVGSFQVWSKEGSCLHVRQEQLFSNLHIPVRDDIVVENWAKNLNVK